MTGIITSPNPTSFAVDAALAGGGVVVYIKPVFGPDGTLSFVYDAASDGVKVKVVGGATTLIDNSVFTPGLDAGLPIMGFADDTSPAVVDEGKIAALRMSKGDRILYVRPGLPTHAVLSAVAVSVSASGDNQIVAAVASQTTKLMGFDLWAAGAVNVKWRNGTTDLQGAAILTANGANYYFPISGEPWGETSVNTALNLNLSAAVAVTGRAWFVTNVPT